MDKLDTCLFVKNQTLVITAHKRDKQDEMFEKVKFAYEQMPQQIRDEQYPWWVWNKPLPKYDNRNELFFPTLNSVIRVSLDSRSGTPSWLHLTELAFRDDAREMMTGTLPSVPKNAPITIETTANWMWGYFFDLWKKCEEEETPPFHTIFLPRYYDPDYISDIEQEIPVELEHLNKLRLTDAQKWWYCERYKELGREIFQEFPSTPEEAFLASGDPVFNVNIVKALPVLRYDQDPIYPHLRWYSRRASHILIGVDTAWWWKDWDYSAISVRDPDMKLIAWFYDRYEPDALCEVINYIWNEFKMWVIGIERNNTGLATLVKAKDYNWYDSLYFERAIDSVTHKQSMKPWWSTNTKTRPLLISEYEEAIRLWYINQVDQRLRNELFTFVYNDKKKPEAILGTHDDFIISDAICYQMRKEWIMENVNDILMPDYSHLL